MLNVDKTRRWHWDGKGVHETQKCAFYMLDEEGYWHKKTKATRSDSPLNLAQSYHSLPTFQNQLFRRFGSLRPAKASGISRLLMPQKKQAHAMNSAWDSYGSPGKESAEAQRY